MLLEYYKMPEKTVEAWRDLWFNTGDYLVMDEEGYFNFVDRKKDALRRRGENISSQEVEKVISGHPAVLESAAIGVKSDMSEDEVMICVTLKPGETLTPEALLDFARSGWPILWCPAMSDLWTKCPKRPPKRYRRLCFVKRASARTRGIARRPGIR